MKIVDKYLFSNIFMGFAAAAALLLPLFSTLDLIAELDDVGKGGYRMIQAIEVVFMSVPRRAVELGPFIALLGGIAALGQLAQSQELTTLRAAGLSTTRIGVTILGAGATLAVALGAMDEFVASPLQQKALQVRAQAIASAGKEGSVWARKDNQLVRIGNLRLGRIPTHIEIFDFNDSDELREYIFADYADIQSDGLWRLNNVQLKHWNEEGRENIQQLDQMSWHSVLRDTRLKEITLPAESLSARQLHRYVQFLKNTGQPAAQYEVAFWQKFGLPLLTLAMILFAVPFTFAQVRSAGLGSKLALGAIVGLLIYVSNQIVVNLGLLFKLNTLSIAILPSFVLLGVAVVIVRRFDRESS